MLKNKDIYKTIFYLTVSISLLLVIIISLCTRGQSFLGNFYWDNNDIFMDYFNSIRDVIIRTPYQKFVIYPPLTNLIYLFFVHLSSIDAMNLVPRFISSYEMRMYQEYMLPFMLYFMVTIIGFLVCCKDLKKGSQREKIIFAFLMLFSAPMLYALERANIIIVALIFTMLFFLWKDSPNKVLKELALISLAIASAIKIYPAIFGILLLSEKRYKEFLRLVAYGCFLLFVPFIFFGGFDQVTVWLSNLLHASSQVTDNYYSYKLNFFNTFGWLSRGSCPNFVSTVFSLLALVSCIASCFFLEQKWKRILFATLLIIGVPSISYVYSATFLVIPLIYFFDSKDKHSKINFIYLLLMTIIMIYIPFSGIMDLGDRLFYKMSINLNTMVESLSVLILTVLLMVQTAVSIVSIIKKKYLRP